MAEHPESQMTTGVRRRGLRRQWLTALAVMLVLMLTTGISAVLSSQLVVSRFSSTATELEVAGAYSARLEEAIAGHENLGHALLANGPVEPEQVLAAQQAAEAEFAAGTALFAEPDMRRIVEGARDAWRASFDDVGLWGTNALSYRFQGIDGPKHEALTNGLDETSIKIREIDEHARGHLRRDLGEANRFRYAAFGLVGGIVGLSLLAMLYFARRMSFDVLRPVEALQEGVGRVRAGELDHQVQLSARQRESELTDLTMGFNEMASQLASTHRELTFRAMHDSLTGLPNRLALRERLAVEFARSGGRREQPDLSVLFVDLDDFKVVNDTLGHAGGDELLVQVAERLASCARVTDTVGRLGGDEFAIVVADSSTGSASAIAERVLGALSAPFVINGQSLTVSASIGIGTTLPDTTGAEELLGQADFAMYMAKGHGKRRYELYDAALHAVTTDHALLRSDLRKSVDSGELRLDYQPVLDLATGVIVGMEALLRWDHPVRGLVPPLEFIPIAEQTGDIDEIGLWVLRTATNQLARWRSAGGEHRNLWMAVNLSPVQLRNEQVVAQLAELLATGPVPADAVVLELTESALVLGVQGAVDALQVLKATGARIALDDFGTGLSSLSTLAGLPVDILKIDRAFVSGQDNGIPSAPVLQTVVALAEHLGLDVIAEGVEVTTQTAALQAVGCVLGQGFGLARPANAEVIGSLLGRAIEAQVVVPGQRGGPGAAQLTDRA